MLETQKTSRQHWDIPMLGGSFANAVGEGSVLCVAGEAKGVVDGWDCSRTRTTSRGVTVRT